MSAWIGSACFFAALIASIVIRAPHEKRGKQTRIEIDRMGTLERVLLVLMGIAVLLLPLLPATTSLIAFADRPLTLASFGAGLAATGVWLWLFHRAHADLGTNWSVSLQVREGHRLVTSGVYARIRHPMYTALFAHALLLANWVAGPATLLAFTAMFALRLGPEERMLAERFGAEYATYARRTRRLVPWVW